MAWFTEPAAQEFTVIHKHQPGKYRTDAPTLLRAPSGKLLSSYVMLPMPVKTSPESGYRAETHVSSSLDNGKTWQETSKVPHEMAVLFLHGGNIYLAGFESGRGSLIVSKSGDEGKTWTEPSVVIEGRYWNTSTGIVIKNGSFYWCMGAANETGKFNGWGSRSLFVAADLQQDITKPSAWRKSDCLYYPGTPSSLRINSDIRSGLPYSDHHLEGNVFTVNDRIRTAWRVRIEKHRTCSMAMICDAEDNGSLKYEFTQFYPFPGAQNHFHIIQDGKTGLYWMTSNMQRYSQDAALQEKEREEGVVSAQRQILALHFSFDALNWIPACYLVIWKNPKRSCNYTTPLIDGDDFIFASRTSFDAFNQHDNDMITFHRLEKFRQLTEPFKREG